jgi:hypothetical protein
LRQFIREDKNVDELGNPLPNEPQRASVEKLSEQKGLTQSRAAKAAIEIASGRPVLQFADFDAEARRLELLVETASKLKDGIKNKDVKEYTKILLTGDFHALELFLTGHS